MLVGATRFKQSQSPWGDGFVDDEPSVLMMQTSWDMVVPDELFRFIPNLRSADQTRWPEPLEWAFQSCLDTRAQREEQQAIDPILRAKAVAMIDTLLLAKREGEMIPFAGECAFPLAFFSGVHPAYIWPEALLAHDRFATFTWLGYAARHRRALMPLEVAIYFLETLKIEERTIASDDLALASYVKSDDQLRALVAAAKLRIRRQAVVFEHRRSPGLLERHWWPL